MAKAEGDPGAAAVASGESWPVSRTALTAFIGCTAMGTPSNSPAATKDTPKPNSTPAGASPATVMAPTTGGMTVPRSPHAPAHSPTKRARGEAGAGGGCSMLIPYPIRAGKSCSAVASAQIKIYATQLMAATRPIAVIRASRALHQYQTFGSCWQNPGLASTSSFDAIMLRAGDGRW